MRFFYSIIICFLILGCSSEEKIEAINLYLQAKKSNDMTSQIHALHTLANLGVEGYQKELEKAQLAEKLYNQALLYKASVNWYQTYLLAHDSYRQFSSNQAQSLLIESGQRFTIVLKADKLLKKSYALLPEHLFEVLAQYQSIPVESWNVANLNKLIVQLTQSIKPISRLLILINNEEPPFESYHTDFALWHKDVVQLHQWLQQIRNSLISEVLNNSATVLLKLNASLTQESDKLLAYVKPDIAKNTLQGDFNEAFMGYFPYQEVMQNIAFSVQGSGTGEVLTWYQLWTEQEKLILMLSGEFEQYVQLSPVRINTVKKIVDANTVFLPKVEYRFENLESFIGFNPTTKSLALILNDDKALVR